MTLVPATAARRLPLDQRGALSLEYIVVAGVGLIVASGLGLLGVALARDYLRLAAVLLSGFP